MTVTRRACDSNLTKLTRAHHCGLLSQTLCHYINQGCTMNEILMRVANLMAYFDLGKLNLA